MNSDIRLENLHQWLKDIFGPTEYTLEPVSGDASFRRYFRFINKQHQLIAVDSPPDRESNEEFVHITHLLASEGLPVPHIHYSTLDFGYFLLEDFGDELLLNALNSENAEELYTQALNALVAIQKTHPENLPPYDKQLLHEEMELFREWYLSKHMGINLKQSDHAILDTTFNLLCESALEQPKVFVHRDYHSRNLMNINARYPAIIDYQDAVNGPITYDLVSLLRDCYIKWPDEKVYNLVLTFFKLSNHNDKLKAIDIETFIKWFDLMGIQRHLKAVGIFARLNIRDNKPNYLNDIPRTLGYIKSIAAKYPETKNLVELIQKLVDPKL